MSDILKNDCEKHLEKLCNDIYGRPVLVVYKTKSVMLAVLMHASINEFGNAS